LSINGQSLGCARSPAGPTLAEVFAAACPAPLAELGERLGSDTLEAALRLWGFDTPPSLELPTQAGDVQVKDPGLAAVGQEALTVTPLHLALMAATIGNGGVMPPAHLALKTETAKGRWQSADPPGQATRVISPALAGRLRALFRASADGQVLGYSNLALAGAELPSHAWFLGLAPSSDPHYAVVVLLEHVGPDGLELAAQIGHDALLAALDEAP
jgi:peptidoglycan glycosyltransferase